MTASHLARSAFVFGLVTGAVAGAAEPMKADSALSANTCGVSVAGQRLTLTSPAFAFMLDTSDGLQAVSWENRLARKTLELGNGPEVEFDIGLPDNPVVTGGTELSLELLQGDREHTLSRFRLWVTNVAKSALPAGYGAPKWIVQGEIPATDRGGLLVVVVELLENGQPVELANFGSLFTAEALVARASAAFRPALGPLGYPSSWQAWRHAVEPRSAPCAFELRIVHSWPGKADRRFSAYFLPRDN